MSRSGDPAHWQKDAVKSAIASYKKMVEDDKKAIRPFLSPNTFKEEETRLVKLKNIIYSTKQARKRTCWLELL